MIIATQPARRTAAFTMVEIALSLAVIAFALVAIIGVLPIGMSVQKDNREETIINFDANYLMNAIRNGALGQDSLTNYIISITNTYTLYDDKTNVVPAGSGVNWYNSYTNPVSSPNFYNAYGAVGVTNFFAYGSNIIGLLSTPKYTAAPGNPAGFFVSNYITADFRAITGSPLDQGISQSSHDFAFSYRIIPELIIPDPVPDPSFTNYTDPLATAAVNASRSNYLTLVRNLQNNLADIRIKFRWPLLPGNQVGTGSQVYRTSASGQIKPTPNPVQTLYFYQPQGYVTNNNPNLVHALAP